MAICWKILEINSTSDEKAIRRAYAKKLKVTRPDEDPAGYQALRAAFDEALVQAAYQREYEERAAANRADSLLEEADSAQLSTESADESPLQAGEFEPCFANEAENSTACEPCPIEVSLADSAHEEITSNPAPEEISYVYQDSALHDEADAEALAEEPLEASALDLVDVLLMEIDEVFETEGEIGILKNWVNWQARIESLPFDESPIFSRALLQRFFAYPVENNYLIQLWTNYFQWHKDYVMAEQLTPEGIHLLQAKVERAEQEVGWAPIPDYLKSISPNLIKTAPEKAAESFYYGILARAANKCSVILSVIYAFFAWIYIAYERTLIPHWKIEATTPKVNRIFSAAKILRYFWRGLLFFGVASIIFSQRFNENIGVPFVIILFCFAIFYFVSGFILGLSKFEVLRKFLYTGNEHNEFFRMIAFPVVGWLFASQVSEQTNNYFILGSLLLGVLLICLSLIPAYIEYKDSRYFWGLVLSTLAIAFFPIPEGYLVLIIIYWINLNVYMTIFKPRIYIYIKSILIYPFVKLPSDTELLLYPFMVVFALVLWFVFLPSLAGEHIFKVKTVSGLLELGFLSFIIAWYGLENIENGLYYFYPISLLVYLIHVGIMRFISHQLAKNAV